MNRAGKVATVALAVCALAGAAVTVFLLRSPAKGQAAAGSAAAGGVVTARGGGADPGSLTTFAIPGGGALQVPASWSHLPAQGGDIALALVAPQGSPAAGAAVTVRAGPANPLPLDRTVSIFEAMQRSVHPNWQSVQAGAQSIPGMSAAQLVVAQYDASTQAGAPVVTSQDLIAHDAAGRAWHVSIVGPAPVVGSRLLNAVALSLRH